VRGERVLIVEVDGLRLRVRHAQVADSPNA
jgi:hypothetical protein